MKTTEAWYADAETRLGRPLTDAERMIDVADGVDVLEAGKARLARAIEAEKRRAIRRWIETGRAVVHLTPAMEDAIDALYRAGQRHAREEMKRMGVQPTLQFVEFRPWRRIRDAVSAGLARLAVRVDAEAARAVFGGTLADDVARAVDRAAPGALDLASRVVSSAYASGLSDVYSANEHLFQGWQYTAVMDNGTCPECEALDGSEFETLSEGLDVMPDFGPNPLCYGEGRCRCRLVPTGAAE